MDISSLIGVLTSADSVQAMGKTTKTDNNAVQSVLAAALPSLISGAQAQSKDSSTGFAEALLSHGQKDTSDLASFLGNVDLEDGGKIIGHLLGGSDSKELASIAKKAGVSQKDTSNILSAAAPLLMSLLGQQSAASASASDASAIGSVASQLLQNVDVGSLLGNLLGGGTTSSAKKKTAAKSNSGVGNIIGSLLGGLLKK